jgi:hypothetical protein
MLPFYRFLSENAVATRLAGSAAFCHTLPPNAHPQAEATRLVARWIQVTTDGGRLAACLLLALGPLAGCAAWEADHWSFDRLRDERAVEIEQRLSHDQPIVQNPFSRADSDDK